MANKSSIPGAMQGEKQAVVVNTVHPNGLMMASVRLVGEWDGIPAADCPWAEYKLPVGNAFIPTVEGDHVWVDFPYEGDSRRPRIVGAVHSAPGGKPNLPPESWGGDGEYVRPEIEGAPPTGSRQPTKDFVSNRNGLLEVRNANGSWEITHLASNSTITINDSGQVYLIGTSDVYIQGDSSITVKSGGNIEIKAAGSIEFKAGSNVTFEAGGAFKSKSSSVNFSK